MSTPKDEWRALDPGTRRVVRRNARRLRAHPDPAVSAVAARYARWYLDARTWRARTQRLAIGLMLADVIAAAAVLGWLSGGPAASRPSTLEKDLIWLAAIVIAAAILLPYAVRKVRIIRLYRLELAMVIAFVPQDPAAVLGAVAVGRRRRKRMERSLRVYGTPLSIGDSLLDHSGEQVAATAAGFAAVPVRRY